MKRDGLPSSYQEQTDDKVRALKHIHTGGRGVSHVGFVIPLPRKDFVRNIKISSSQVMSLGELVSGCGTE